MESRRHGRAQEGNGASGNKAGSLPGSARHHLLHLHSPHQILPQDHELVPPVGVQEEELHRIAQVEMIDLVAGEAVQGWARTHRFAGSKDRAEIASIVFSVSRRKAELAWHMNDEAPRP